MGTKRVFDEDLHGFIKHPKYLDYGFKPASVAENHVVGLSGGNDISVPDIFDKFEITKPLPLVTGEDDSGSDSGSVPVFSANTFSEYFEYNFPRRQLFHYDDIYSSLLDRSPRNVIPVGPDNQADVPEFDTELAKKYIENGGMDHFLGVCVIPFHHSNFDSDVQMGCECLDGGSIRCVQEHVKEARLKLRKFYGDVKFADLGMLEMGEEVSCRWSKEEERVFHQVVYSNPESLGRMFWKQLSLAFPCRTKKELVSYYFNVFVLHGRAVQNRSHFLDIDSDDDEWQGSYKGTFEDSVEYDDFSLGNHDSSSEDGGSEDILGCSKNVKNDIQ